ncbi:MAG: hypothetical protein JST28_09970 [Acidobacteria bacterium]|nr:hypothetical protein [Acidobacteriota bacterium]
MLYRQANLGVLRWSLEPAQMLMRPQVDRAAVQPGDVVLNKIMPIRASWVTSRLRRHPVDANCILVRGLDPASSFWIAFCLNQPLYKEYLAASAEGSALPRLKLRSLRELPVLPAPAAFIALAVRAANVLNELLGAEEVLRAEIDAAEERITPPEIFEFWKQRVAAIDRRSWWKRIPGQVVPESLSPGHALSEVLREELQANFGWIPLTRCLAPISEGEKKEYRQRFAPIASQQIRSRCLRISDVGSDFTITEAPELLPIDWPGRVYQLPLQPAEVLSSLLVSSSKVAFAGHFPPDEIHLTDHWERLAFRETPGAWAIIFNSPLVRIQLRLLAQGSARQFVGSDSLGQIVVPNLPHEERLPLHRFLSDYQQKRLSLEREWRRVNREAQEIFEAAHGRTLTDSPVSYAWNEVQQ